MRPGPVGSEADCGFSWWRVWVTFSCWSGTERLGGVQVWTSVDGGQRDHGRPGWRLSDLLQEARLQSLKGRTWCCLVCQFIISFQVFVSIFLITLFIFNILLIKLKRELKAALWRSDLSADMKPLVFGSVTFGL